MHIWSLQTRRIVATLNGHGGQGVTWLKTLPQGQQLLRWVVASQGRSRGIYAGNSLTEQEGSELNEWDAGEGWVWPASL